MGIINMVLALFSLAACATQGNTRSPADARQAPTDNLAAPQCEDEGSNVTFTVETRCYRGREAIDQSFNDLCPGMSYQWRTCVTQALNRFASELGPDCRPVFTSGPLLEDLRTPQPDNIRQRFSRNSEVGAYNICTIEYSYDLSSWNFIGECGDDVCTLEPPPANFPNGPYINNCE